MSTKEESALRVGSLVATKWRLDELVAHSAVAATYKATHRNGLTAAIKIIHRSHGQSSAVVERFLQEAHLANRVDHPGVERIFDDGVTEDGAVFLVMEYLEGVSLELHRVSLGGRLEPPAARPIVDRLLDVLVAIHAAGVIHRNLKPSNVFLTKDDRVVLTDFGRARFAEGDALSPLSLDGVIRGTPAYMAPEQARGRRKDVDERSDLWSAGAILFTLLSGRKVHRGKTMQEKLASAQAKRAPPLAYVLPGVDPAVAAVVDRALAFDKADRFASASEMRRAYWLATGRSEASLPPERAPGERARPAFVSVLPQHEEPAPPAMGQEAGAARVPPEAESWPEPMRASIASLPDPSLLPPPIDAFVERAAPARPRAELKTVGRTAFVVLFVLAFLGLAATLVVIFYSKDDVPAAR